MTKHTSRGRPRSFDKQAKLTAITQAFLGKKGFDGTSLDDLSASTNLTRPSLYAAYGDKESMFLLSLQSFAEQVKSVAVAAAQREADAQDCLEYFYAGALDLYFSQPGRPLGCLVFSTAITNAGSNARIRQSVGKFLRQMDSVVMNLLQAKMPRLSDDEAASLAQLASGMLVKPCDPGTRRRQAPGIKPAGQGLRSTAY